jgi:hypothetical protein
MTDHHGFHHPVSDPEYLAECAYPESRRRLSLVEKRRQSQSTSGQFLSFALQPGALVLLQLAEASMNIQEVFDALPN